MTRRAILALAMLLASIGLTEPAAAKSEQQKCDEAASVARSFLGDPNFAALRAGLRQARAVVIMPRFEPGFWGVGDDDDAVLLVQREDGTFSHPAFYNTGDGSVVKGMWGRGGSVMLLVMTDRALEVLLSAFSDVRIGTHLTVAVGPAGNAPLPPNFDIVSFGRSYQGYSGGSVSGIDIEIDKGDNQDYYGYGALPRAITIENRFRNPGADNLRNALIGR
ncbi:MAG: lipid-binding SYLF domain-containing protein [Alphaproteobacteria bacterium]|nr:lipid-binding SYLF domain-containing protein [Alphaproteobacteria bacterium]